MPRELAERSDGGIRQRRQAVETDVVALADLIMQSACCQMCPGTGLIDSRGSSADTARNRPSVAGVCGTDELTTRTKPFVRGEEQFEGAADTPHAATCRFPDETLEMLMSFSTIRYLLPILVTLSLPAAATGQARPGPNVTPAPDQPQSSANAKDGEQVADLMRSLETTLEQLNRSRLQAVNVRKVLETIDSGAIKTTEKERLKTNQFVRKQLTKEFRELRVRSRATLTEIDTALLPKQRGLMSKLRARWELADKASTKDRIGQLLADYEQTVVETEEQVRHLESGIARLDAAIRILEEQLSYLDLVEETLELGREVATRLQDLNREIDQVVNALIERESQQ